MKEKNAIFFITILNGLTKVYFDTFFIFYFFKVANYELLPLAKYYISVYFFTGLGFFLIRNAMKKNVKVPYFRIGIALKALYISLIMLLKDNIINWIFLVGFIKGMSDGFYHYPKNILDTEKITNDDRQKYSGLVSIIDRVGGIVIPIVLGVALTFLSYTQVGKIFFILFLVMFGLSFFIKEEYKPVSKCDIKKYFKFLKSDKDARNAFVIPLLSGFTYSSGVMGLIITLLKINGFKTNFNLGLVDSICAGLALLTVVVFTVKIKSENFDKVLLGSGIISFISLAALGIFSNFWTLIIYFLVRQSSIKLINLISNNKTANLSNTGVLKDQMKEEFYLVRDIFFAIARCSGYLILLVVCLFFGMDYINYILIICGAFLLLEAIYASRIVISSTEKTT